MKSILEKNIPNAEQSQKFAQDFYEQYLKDLKGAVVFFEGGLGVGKTLMIRAILKSAGVLGDIPSPTYTFVQEYQAESQQFAHFDFYRFKDPQEFFARGFDEIAGDSECIKLVEWPDKISLDTQKRFTGKHYVVQLKHGVGVSMRSVKVLN